MVITDQNDPTEDNTANDHSTDGMASMPACQQHG